ncbi:hypothetical protein EGT07_09960 [Herbaspirillum sp. HC18]|nr:hypothetical protein EGT07_09960 [Herbaspirillum sp. HC18]
MLREVFSRHRSSGSAWLLCIIALLAEALLPRAARAEVMELRHPSAVIQPEGSAALSKQAVTLPFNWDPQYAPRNGIADFRFTFPKPAGEANLHGLFIERIGNRYAIWLNGTLLDDRINGYSAHYNFGKEPHYYVVPAMLLRPENELHVLIVAEGGRLAALSAPKFGPETELRGQYRDRYRVQMNTALVLSVVAAIFGLMGLVVWWRERNSQFLYFSGATLSWSARMFDPLLEHVPFDWRNWSLILVTTYTTYVFLSYKFAFEVLKHKSGAEERLSKPIGYLFLPALSIAFTAIWFQWVPLWKAWRWGMLLFTVVGALALAWLAIRRKTLDHTILAVAFTIGVSCGFADYLATLSSGVTHSVAPLSRYGSLLMIVSFVWILMERYMEAQRAIQRSRDELAVTLAERERELARVYEARAQTERENAATEERQRITRDLHDGLGMQITTAMHLAAKQDAPRELIARQLRETLEQLKLTVDALEDVGNDLGAVLGNIRFRLAGRIESSGVNLHWEVDRLPTLPGLTSGKVRHIQFIVLEAITNAINHSGARNLTIRAWHDADANVACIAIQDDGLGFNPESARRGRGMTNMQTRAQALGAVLDVNSSKEESTRGTIVELQLPFAA